MRASESQRRHHEEQVRLEGVLQKKSHALLELTDPGNYADLVANEEALLLASEAAQTARVALDEHKKKQIDPVRNYRVLDAEDGSELDRFRITYELAPSTAVERWGEKVTRYDLQEQLSDGT